MIKNSALVQGYFQRNPGVDTLFFVETQPFFQENDAQSQVKNLKKEGLEVVPVTREEAFAEAAASEGGSEGGSGAPAIEQTGGAKKTLEEYAGDVTAAEAALTAATEAKDEEAIAAAKKKLSTAKAQLTRATNAAASAQ